MLPTRAGLGLKPEHFRNILESGPDIGFFEVHAENYMVSGGPMHHYLGKIREHYPLSLHGVGLSIGADAPLDKTHLDALTVMRRRFFLSTWPGRVMVTSFSMICCRCHTRPPP